MAKRINIKHDYGVGFDYEGKSYSLSALKWNPYTYCWLTDITVDTRVIYGVTIRSGVNILRQYGLDLNIYVINTVNITLDPIDFNTIYLFVFERGDLEEIVNTSGLLDILENSA